MGDKAMQKLLAGMLFVLGMTVGAQAQTPISVGVASCGRSGAPVFNCYSVPLTVGGVTGTAWMYPQGSGGFILFRPALEGDGYVTAQVTSTTVNARNAIGQVTQETITFTLVGDPGSDGDSDSVVGSITVNLSWTFKSGSSGRAGGSGWYMTIMGGSGAQSITQD